MAIAYVYLAEAAEAAMVLLQRSRFESTPIAWHLPLSLQENDGKLDFSKEQCTQVIFIVSVCVCF